MSKFSLNVDSPEKVADVLLEAAQAYHEAHDELQIAWQDKHAGREWYRIARALEACAERIKRELARK